MITQHEHVIAHDQTGDNDEGKHTKHSSFLSFLTTIKARPSSPIQRTLKVSFGFTVLLLVIVMINWKSEEGFDANDQLAPQLNAQLLSKSTMTESEQRRLLQQPSVSEDLREFLPKVPSGLSNSKPNEIIMPVRLATKTSKNLASKPRLVDPIDAILSAAPPFTTAPSTSYILGRPLRAAILGFDQRWKLTDTMTYGKHFTRCNCMMYCERYGYDLYDFSFTHSNTWLRKFLEEWQLPWAKLPLVKEFMRSAIQKLHLNYDVVVWVDSDVTFDLNYTLDDFIRAAEAEEFLTSPEKLFFLWNDHTPTRPNFGFVMFRTHNIPLMEQIFDVVFSVPGMAANDTTLLLESHRIPRDQMKKMYPAEEGAFNIAVCHNPKYAGHVTYFDGPFIYGPTGKFLHHVSSAFLEMQWSFFQTEFALDWRKRLVLLSNNASAVKWSNAWAHRQTRRKEVNQHLTNAIGMEPIQETCQSIFHHRRCYGNCLSKSCSKCVCGSISSNQKLGKPLMQLFREHDLPETFVTHEELACLVGYRSLGNQNAMSEIQITENRTIHSSDSSRKTLLLIGLMQLSPRDCPGVVSDESESDLCSIDGQMQCIKYILLNGQNDIAKAKSIRPPERANRDNVATTRPLFVEASSWPWMFPPSCERDDLLRRDNLYAYLTAEQAIEAAAATIASN